MDKDNRHALGSGSEDEPFRPGDKGLGGVRKGDNNLALKGARAHHAEIEVVMHSVGGLSYQPQQSLVRDLH